MADKMKIAVLDDWAGVARDYADWDSLGYVNVFTDPLAEGDLPDLLAPYEVICLMRERTPFPAKLIAALPNLRLLVTTGPRNASIDMDAAQAHGVTVCATESRKTSTAELTLTMVLHQMRGIGRETARLQGGGFQGAPGRDMTDLRIGLVGIGNIGKQVAALSRAFGIAQISAWSPNLTQQRADEAGVTFAPTVEELAATSDVLSIHMVMSHKVAGLVGASALASLPPSALVVNTSRAGLLDRDALFAWLAKDETAMAAIDVFEAEPLAAGDPWRAASKQFGDRLLLTPHLGYVTQATWRVFYTQTVDAVAAYQAGEPIRVL